MSDVRCVQSLSGYLNSVLMFKCATYTLLASESPYSDEDKSIKIWSPMHNDDTKLINAFPERSNNNNSGNSSDMIRQCDSSAISSFWTSTKHHLLVQHAGHIRADARWSTRSRSASSESGRRWRLLVGQTLDALLEPQLFGNCSVFSQHKLFLSLQRHFDLTINEQTASVIYYIKMNLL